MPPFKTKRPLMGSQPVNWQALGILLCDGIGAVSLFASGYVLLLVAHSFGVS